MDAYTAIVKRPSPTLIDRCELTFLEREPMSFSLLEHQHRAYLAALESMCCNVVVLDADPTLPDSVFVEDTAVVLDECVVITRPGTVSRRRETEVISSALVPHRPHVARIVAPGTLEGGDVLRIGRTLFVGLTTRTNREGIEQLAALTQPWGYEVKTVPVTGSLHLKTACTALDADTLLINSTWLDISVFSDFRMIATCDSEPFAANTLSIGNALIANAAFPRTLERVAAHTRLCGQRIVTVDISEFGKAEAGLTCMSLLFGDRAG